MGSLVVFKIHLGLSNGVPPRLVISPLTMVIIGRLVGTTVYGQTHLGILCGAQFVGCDP